MVACRICWRWGKTFPSRSKCVMPDDIDDIQDPRYHMKRRTLFEPVNIVLCTCGFAWAWMATCSECLPERACLFQPTEHVPRTLAGTQTCLLGPGGLPACHGAESTRKGPRSEEKKMPKGEKNTFLYMYNVPLRDVCWSEISGVTQVVHGHAGNTAVATAYLCWVKHGNRNSRTGVPVDYYYQHLLWTLICYLFVAFVSETFFGSKKSSNWLVSLTIKDCRECKPASNVDCRGLTHIVRALWGFW